MLVRAITPQRMVRGDQVRFVVVLLKRTRTECETPSFQVSSTLKEKAWLPLPLPALARSCRKRFALRVVMWVVSRSSETVIGPFGWFWSQAQPEMTLQL